MKEQVIRYLIRTYQPVSILLYGSYVAGDFDEASDFDCMVIVAGKTKSKDTNVIDGVPLDCDIFSVEEILNDDGRNLMKLHDAEIVLDYGIGAIAKKKCLEYLESIKDISDEERESIVSWLMKTLKRALKDDSPEAYYRRATLMWESLPDYFFLRSEIYYGCKKAIAFLKENDAKAYDIFSRAVTLNDENDLKEWVEYVIESEK